MERQSNEVLAKKHHEIAELQARSSRCPPAGGVRLTVLAFFLSPTAGSLCLPLQRALTEAHGRIMAGPREAGAEPEPMPSMATQADPTAADRRVHSLPGTTVGGSPSGSTASSHHAHASFPSRQVVNDS